MTRNSECHWERESRLDRDFGREPSYGRRQRIPLVETGTLKQRFAAPTKANEAPPLIVAVDPRVAEIVDAGIKSTTPQALAEPADKLREEEKRREHEKPVEKPVVVPPAERWSDYVDGQGSIRSFYEGVAK